MDRHEAQGAADRALVPVQGRRTAPAGEVQVRPAVVVAVEDRDPAADRVGEVAVVGVVDARRCRLVDEVRRTERRRRRAAPELADTANPPTATTITTARPPMTSRSTGGSSAQRPSAGRPEPRPGRHHEPAVPGVVLLGQGPGLLAALGADPPADEVVGLDVDPAVQARLAGLVGRVVVRRPLEVDVGRRPLLELERAGRDRVAADAAREVLAAGEAGRRPRRRPG